MQPYNVYQFSLESPSFIPHIPTMIHKHNSILLWCSTLIIFVLVVSCSELDGEVLLKFKASLKNTAALGNWNSSVHPCGGWKGILCNGGRVWGLQLENMGLKGAIDVETLAKLPDLRSVSFMNNDFEGSLPNLTRLGSFKTIFLSNNKFSGEIPKDSLYGMLSLKKLHLANNKFTGPIPQTLASTPKLIQLMLQDNEFQGQIPYFQQQGLRMFNVTNNRLDGEIPQTLAHFNSSSFSGNKGLCGAPLQQCHKFPVTTVVIVAVLVVAALVAFAAVCIFFFFFFFFCRKKPTAADLNQMERGATASSAVPDDQQTSKPAAAVKQLTFLRDDEADKFDMQELLRASAEVLGGGAFGSTYKAGVDGKMMVVKRFKHMNKVSKQDFNEHMRRLGRMRHQNVHPILAFYYKKEEKLLVADFAQNASLAARLHGNQSSGLDWKRRLKIVKGVGKGLLYLHNELPSLTPPHAHLKTSNVLLDATFEPLLTDYGLLPVLNKEQAQENMIAYKSPEYKNTAKLTKKTDVWSFGVIILEILTRKTPQDTDLVTWVESATNDGVPVFDKEMAASSECQGEMMKLFNIALSCCRADHDGRPDIKEVVDKVDEIMEKDLEECELS